MGLFIHRGAKFNKCLNALKKSGGKAALAAGRAEGIIQELAAKGGITPDDFCRLTKHGELRIPKCKKYDLGGGYRLVGVELGEHLVLSYAGAHDACDRWIENNRKFEPAIEEQGEEVSAGRVEPKDEPNEDDPLSGREEDYADLLLEKIDERTLRRVFRGLCGESRG